MAVDDACEHEMLVQIRWRGRKMAVPLLQRSYAGLAMVDRRQQSGAQQFGQLSRINPVTLVARLQQGIPSWIAHHDFRDVRLEQIVQPSRPGSFFKGSLASHRAVLEQTAQQ